MPSDPRLGIALVSYHSAATLPDCLESIYRYCPNALVVVTENSGDTGGVAAIAVASGLLDVEVVDPGGNVGYAKGVNLAAARIMSRSCTHLLILNPDVQLTADPVELVVCLDRADVVAGVLASSAPSDSAVQRGELEASNVKREITWRSSVVQALVGTRFNRIRRIPVGRLLPVPQVDGAYMLQSVDYYRHHPLDERFELYFEDVDYCDRARRGRGVAVMGVRCGVHVGGASFVASPDRAYVVNRVSWARYLRRKYSQRPRRVIAVPFVVELVVRTVTRQAEGSVTRRRAYSLAMRELRTPGLVRVLEEAEAPPARREAP